MENKITIKQIILSSIAGPLLLAGIKYGSNYVTESRNATESRGYAVQERFEAKSLDLDGDGKKETLANYNGKAYLFKVGTNGVPYFQPIKGLEIEVEKE